MSDTREAFVADMLDENPEPVEKFINFDPPYPRSVIRPLEKMGWIETRGSGRETAHRWTVKGRAAVRALKAKS